MIISLLDIWKNRVKEKYADWDNNKMLFSQWMECFKSASFDLPSVDPLFVQSSIAFEAVERVVFVKSKHSLTGVSFYEELPVLSLEKEELFAVEALSETLRKNPSFYDGDHVLAKEVLYDSESKVIYLEAVRVSYSFLVALQQKKFPENSPLYHLDLYQVGVIVPFVTEDDAVFLMERNGPFKLYSAAAGFLEPRGDRKALETEKEDLVVYTAEKEAIQEFLGSHSSPEESRIGFERPYIASLSFRETKTGIGTIEFMMVMRLSCDREALKAILRDNQASDKQEHTGNFHEITLRSEERREAIQFLKLRKSGSFLYDPILLAASFDRDKSFFPTHLPGSRTGAMPVEAFMPGISRRLTLRSKEEERSKHSEGEEKEKPLFSIARP